MAGSQTQRTELYTLLTLAVLLVCGLFITGFAASWRSLSVALLWALASFASGGLSGFLFGMPRAGSRTKQLAAPQEEVDGFQAGLGINTNLEEISDWLTKILVGIGLVEARDIGLFVSRLAIYVGDELGPNRHAAAAGILIYFGILGVLSGFLLTRLFLSPAFERADRETRGGNALAKAEKALEENRASKLFYDILDAATPVAQSWSKPGAVVDKKVAQKYVDVLLPYDSDELWSLHRRYHLLLANFLWWSGQEALAIIVLERFVALKGEKGEPDLHMAAALYNLACYHSRLAERAHNIGNAMDEMKEKAFCLESLKKGVGIWDSDKVEAAEDPDFDWMKGDADFQAVVN